MVNGNGSPAPIAVNVWEAARLLGVSPNTVRNLHYAGRLKTTYIGRRLLVPTESLTELIKSGMTRQAAG